jgi:hypothetical protein
LAKTIARFIKTRSSRCLGAGIRFIHVIFERQIDGVEVRQGVLGEHDCPMRQYVKQCHE